MKKSFLISLIPAVIILAIGITYIVIKFQDKPQDGVLILEKSIPTIPFNQVGDTQTTKMQVHGYEASDHLEGVLYGRTEAKEDAMFAFVDVTITNTTDQSYMFYLNPSLGDSIRLVDTQGRKFMPYQATSGGPGLYEDRALDSVDLGPGVPNRGLLIYEVPLDTEPYAIEVADVYTHDVVRFLVNE